MVMELIHFGISFGFTVENDLVGNRVIERIFHLRHALVLFRTKRYFFVFE